MASSPADPSQAFPWHPMPQLSFSPYLASLSPQTEWPNLTWKSIQLFWVTTVVFALRAERKQKEDGPGFSQLLMENKQSRTLRAMLGLVVEFSKKKRQNSPKSLPRRLDPGTQSSSAHLYFALLPLAFPMGRAPGFVTFNLKSH